MKKYLVGGAVRDKLLGLQPTDLDWVIVGATQEDLDAMLAEGYVRVGADFPVFLHPTSGEEYALARTERKVGEGYGGFVTDSSPSITIEEDLMRRDLTINSMALAEDGELIDPYGGFRDLHNHVLRHTSDAFVEDPLRVMRLARFVGRYNFEIAESTVELCNAVSASGELNSLSCERIWVELQKGMETKHPAKMLEVLEQTGALKSCDLLRKLFGPEWSTIQRDKFNLLDVIPTDARFISGVAALSEPFFCEDIHQSIKALTGAPSRLVQAIKNVNLIFSNTSYNAKALTDLLRSLGAMREGVSFTDVLMAAALLELTGDKRWIFTPRQFQTAARVMHEVKADQFPELKGAVLGEAIRKKQQERVHEAIFA